MIQPTKLFDIRVYNKTKNAQYNSIYIHHNQLLVISEKYRFENSGTTPILHREDNPYTSAGLPLACQLIYHFPKILNQ